MHVDKMNENYLKIVRKNLYKEKEIPTKKQPKKKISIAASDLYKSENAFVDYALSEQIFEKIKTRVSTPFPKKSKKNSRDDKKEKNKKGMKRLQKPQKKFPKKQQLVLSFSDDDEEEDDNSGVNIPPSYEQFSSSQTPSCSSKVSFSNKQCIDNNDGGGESYLRKWSSSDDSDNEEFTLDRFFQSRDYKSAESITTEPHSGIDNEFVSDYVKKENVKISKVKIIEISSDSEEDNKGSAKEEAAKDTDLDDTVHLFEQNTTEHFSNEQNGSNSVICLDDTFESEYNEIQSSNNNNLLDDIQKDWKVATDDFWESNNLAGQKQSLLNSSISNNFIEFTEEHVKLVVLKEHSTVAFFGMFHLQVLYGTVEILGVKLDSSSGLLNIYSPRGTSLLFMKNINENGNKIDLLALFKNYKDLKKYDIDEKTAVIKCTKLFDKNIELVEKYISQQIFPKSDSQEAPRVIFNPKETFNVLTINESWDHVLNTVTPETKLLIAGGKGVGKSTFLRYAINKLLDTYNEIRVIDLDPGQSEFYLPGTIYVLTVKERVFGPNYTHIKKPEKAILCDINVGNDPSTYVKNVALLMNYISTLDEDVPTLINYMGFSRGIGLKIISSALTYIQPTDIVQIDSKFSQKNFPADLTLQTVKENCDFFGGDFDNCKFKLHKVMSISEENTGGWSAEPRLIREMCILAYLGQMMREEVNSLTSDKVPMYQIKLSSLNIRSLANDKLHPAAINANLVALCELDDPQDVSFVCHGYGIVRGIDMDKDQLVLITPEPLNSIKRIKTLVLGSISLPPSVYMSPDNIVGTVPYVMEGQLVSLGQMTKRTYLPPNKK